MRAYNYLRCSMNDAFDCNSRLRFAEIKDYSIVVNKAYIDMQNQKYVTMRRTVIVTVMLVVVMLASIIMTSLLDEKTATHETLACRK